MRLLSRDLAREDAGARQDGLDGRAFVGRLPPHAHPVANRGQVATRLRLVPHPARHISERLVVLEVHAKRRAVRDGHARRQQAFRTQGLEEHPLPFRPPELDQIHPLPLTVDRFTAHPPAASRPPPAVRPPPAARRPPPALYPWLPRVEIRPG